MAPEVLEGAITFNRESFLRIDVLICTGFGDLGNGVDVLLKVRHDRIPALICFIVWNHHGK
jgi:hypothetical protein